MFSWKYFFLFPRDSLVYLRPSGPKLNTELLPPLSLWPESTISLLASPKAAGHLMSMSEHRHKSPLRFNEILSVWCPFFFMLDLECIH